jgi:hypothetical protein
MASFGEIDTTVSCTVAQAGRTEVSRRVAASAGPRIVSSHRYWLDLGLGVLWRCGHFAGCNSRRHGRRAVFRGDGTRYGRLSFGRRCADEIARPILGEREWLAVLCLMA